MKISDNNFTVALKKFSKFIKGGNSVNLKLIIPAIIVLLFIQILKDSGKSGIIIKPMYILPQMVSEGFDGTLLSIQIFYTIKQIRMSDKKYLPVIVPLGEDKAETIELQRSGQQYTMDIPATGSGLSY